MMHVARGQPWILAKHIEQMASRAKRFRSRRLSFGMSLAITALFLAGSTASVGLTRKQSPQIPLSPYVGKLKTLRMTIAGREVTLLFDTGAGYTSITPQLAGELGCTPFGSEAGHRMNGEKVTFARCAPQQFRLGPIACEREFAVFDLRAVLPDGLPPVHGVVGLDVFEGRTITLLPGLSAIRFPSNAEVVRLGRPSAVRFAREGSGASLSAFAPADTPRGKAWLLIDSGNLVGIKLHQWVFDALAVPGTPPSNRQQLVVEGTTPIDLNTAIAAPLIYDGALGIDYIDRFEPTIDLARSRIWWNPATRRQAE